MTHQQLQQLLHRYRCGECTPEEEQVVDQWYDALNYPEAKLNLQERAAFEAALWEHIASKTVDLTEPAAVDTSVGQAKWLRWAAAAVAVLGCGLGVIWQQQPTEVAQQTMQPANVTAADTVWVLSPNHTSKPIRIALQDGSLVTLEPASSLRYPRQFRGAKRQVYLQGEGFFSVAHNPAKPFQVYTDKIVTTVLGTSFTVRAFAGQREALVKVRTGRVQVSARVNQKKTKQLASILLLPNQQTVYAPDQPELVKELVAEPVLLMDESFIFNDRPVAEVLTALEKAYAVRILYDQESLANCTVSIALREKTLYGKLDLLCKTINASYQVKGTQIFFSSKGCPKE